VGVDLSPRMVEEACRRCGARGQFLVADLAEPLPVEPASFDGITCSLALHYLADWTVPLQSFATALRPGGWAVISLDHPAGRPLPSQRGAYFDTEVASLRELERARGRRRARCPSLPGPAPSRAPGEPALRAEPLHATL